VRFLLLKRLLKRRLNKNTKKEFTRLKEKFKLSYFIAPLSAKAVCFHYETKGKTAYDFDIAH
jgi:hypothetical protein